MKNAQELLDSIPSSPLRVCVLGASCSGKSSFIRHLLDDEIETPVNTFSRSIACHVEYGGHLRYEQGGVEIPAKSISQDLNTANGPLIIQSPHPILRESNSIISECPESDIPSGELTFNRLLRHIGVCDACVYLISAQMPFSKTDGIIMQYLNAFGIPTHVFLSRMEYIDDADSESVYRFVQQSLPTTETLCLHPATNLKDAALSVRNVIFSHLADGQSARRNAFCSLLTEEIALQRQQEREAQEEKVKEQLKKIAEIRREKERALLQKNDAVHDIANQIAEKEAVLENEIISQINGKIKDDFIRELTHDIETTADAKLYWEKTLAYRMEHLFMACRGRLEGRIQQELAYTIQQAEIGLKKIKFRSTNSSVPHFISIDIQVGSTPNAPIEDVQRARNMARLGTAAIIGVAGTVLATAGVGGAMLAISALAGVGSNVLVEYKEKKNKEKIMQLMPQAVDSFLSKVCIEVAELIQGLFSELSTSILKAGKECYNEEMEQIDIEDKRAKYNATSILH